MGKNTLIVVLCAFLLGGYLDSDKGDVINTSESNNKIIIDSNINKYMIDINKDDVHTIAALREIDIGKAQEIVDNRPYDLKVELVSKDVISLRDYEKIKDYITAGD